MPAALGFLTPAGQDRGQAHVAIGDIEDLAGELRQLERLIALSFSQLPIPAAVSDDTTGSEGEG